MQKHLLMFVKLAVSTALIALVLSRTDLDAVLNNVAGAHISWLGIAAIFFFVAVALGIARWRLVLKSLGTRLPVGTATRLFFIGMFFNQTLPSSIGGDALRVYYLWKDGTRLQTAVNSVLLDRIIGLIIVIVVTTAVAPHLVAQLANPIAANGLIAALVASWCGVFALFFFNNSFSRSFQKFRIINFAVLLSRDAASLFAQPAIAIPTIGISIAIHAATIAIAWSLDQALGGDTSFLIYVAALTPTILLISIPISIAGWGVREQILIILLGAMGLGATQAITVSILFGIILLAGGLPGGVLWLITKRDFPIVQKPENPHPT